MRSFSLRIMLLLCLLPLAACNLQNMDEVKDNGSVIIAEQTPEVTPEVTVDVTPEVTEAVALIPPALPPVPVVAAPVVSLRDNCTLNNTWPTYTVMAGDTLARIASNTDTSVAVLTDANCLANADVILRGQVLRVPNLSTSQPAGQPASQPAVPQPGAVVGYHNEGVVTVSPSIDNNGAVQLQPNTRVDLVWTVTQLPAGAIVFFKFELDKEPGILQEIGRDVNITDGVSTSWLVPVGVYGTLTAEMRREGVTLFTSGPIDVNSRVGSKQDNQPSLPSTYRDEGQITVQSGENRGGTISLKVGSPIQLFWYINTPVNDPGAYAEFYFAEPYWNPPTLIGTDTQLSDGITMFWNRDTAGGGALTGVVHDSAGNILFSTLAATLISLRTKDMMLIPEYAGVNVTPILRTEPTPLVYVYKILKAGSPVTVSWSLDVSNPHVSHVDFYYGYTLIGTDNDMSDGASIEWVVPDNIDGSLNARAMESDGFLYTNTSSNPLSTVLVKSE